MRAFRIAGIRVTYIQPHITKVQATSATTGRRMAFDDDTCGR
jgi:hypothetical protein